MNDLTSKAARGRVQIDSRKNRKFRLRVSYVHEDQLEVILAALKKARAETGTEIDAYALTMICLHFLA